jgi:hypothetical protein
MPNPADHSAGLNQRSVLFGLTDSLRIKSICIRGCSAWFGIVRTNFVRTMPNSAVLPTEPTRTIKIVRGVEQSRTIFTIFGDVRHCSNQSRANNAEQCCVAHRTNPNDKKCSGCGTIPNIIYCVRGCSALLVPFLCEQCRALSCSPTN